MPDSILFSFVGFNDAGNLAGKPDGAILTVFRERAYDEVHLIWNSSSHIETQLLDIADYVKTEIIKRGFCKNVRVHHLNCKDVTDHNEIYPKLLDFCKSLDDSRQATFTAAIASGTPAMQVCWILMAESGDFALQLIRSNEPKFGKPAVTEVKLGTGLPKIMRLQEENSELIKKLLDVLPEVVIDVKNGVVRIAGIEVGLSPIGFSYYRYFAERAVRGEGLERMSGITTSLAFMNKIIEFHRESFPEAELFRAELERMTKLSEPLAMSTFRANVSKINKKFRETLSNKEWVKTFSLAIEGKRHSKSYGLNVPAKKIIIQ